MSTAAGSPTLLMSNYSPVSVGLWLKDGWHVAVAYVIGFFRDAGVLGSPSLAHPNPVSRRSLVRVQTSPTHKAGLPR